MTKILIIDDQEQWASAFAQNLQLFYPLFETTIVDYKEFRNLFSNSESFNDFSFAFVDLELGITSLPGIEDTLGGDTILPAIRNFAPWVSAACISMYISQDKNVLCRLVEFGFDALLPKELLLLNSTPGQVKTAPEFTKPMLEKLFADCRTNSSARALGESVFEIRNRTNYSPGIKWGEVLLYEFTEEEQQAIEEAICIFGIKGQSISIEPLAGGKSSSRTTKLTVIGDENFTNGRSTWVLKMNSSISKSHEESNGYKRFQKSAFFQKMLPNTIYPNALYCSGFGFLIYRFEQDIETLYESATRNLDNISQPVTKLFTELTAHKKVSAFKLLPLPSCFSLDLTEDCLEALGMQNVDILHVTTCIIHGDLNLRNILVGSDSQCLIDFADSDENPIVIDIAKLIIDSIVFLTNIELDVTRICWKAIEGSELSTLWKAISTSITLEDDDLILLNILLKLFALTYMNYEGVRSCFTKDY